MRFRVAEAEAKIYELINNVIAISALDEEDADYETHEVTIKGNKRFNEGDEVYFVCDWDKQGTYKISKGVVTSCSEFSLSIDRVGLKPLIDCPSTMPAFVRECDINMSIEEYAEKYARIRTEVLMSGIRLNAYDNFEQLIEQLEMKLRNITIEMVN